MIWMYIIFTVLILIFVILLSPIHILVTYKKRIEVRVEVFGVRFKLFDGNSGNGVIKPQKTEYSSSKKAGIGSFKKRGIIGSLKLFLKILRSSYEMFNKIFKKIRVNKFKICVEVGAADAATAAVRYGQVCCVVYPLASVVRDICTPKEFMVKVDMNFLVKNFSFDGELDISSCIFNIIPALFAFIKKYRELT